MALTLVGWLAFNLVSRRADHERQWGFIDTTGRFVVPAEYDEVHSFSNGLAAVRHGHNWGFVDRDGQVVIDLRFRRVGSFTEAGIAWAENEEGVGYILRDGSWDINPVFHRATDFVGDVAMAAMVVGRTSSTMSGSTSQSIYSYGLIDRDGRWIVEPLSYRDERYWSTPGRFSLGRAPVQIDGDLWTYVDESGRLLGPPRYARAGEYIDGTALTELPDGTHELLDPDGDAFLTIPVRTVFRGEGNKFTVQAAIGGEEGNYLLDARVDTVLIGPYEEAGLAAEGRIAVGKRGAMRVVDYDGTAYGESWSRIEQFSEGFAAVARSQRKFLSDYLWAYVDLEGRVVIESQFNRAEPFHEGRAAVAVAVKER